MECNFIEIWIKHKIFNFWNSGCMHHCLCEDWIKSYNFRYLIKDLSGQRQYLIDIALTVCLSDSLPCEIRNNILQNYLVTKPVCAWYTGFLIPGNFWADIYDNWPNFLWLPIVCLAAVCLFLCELFFYYTTPKPLSNKRGIIYWVRRIQIWWS